MSLRTGVVRDSAPEVDAVRPTTVSRLSHQGPAVMRHAHTHTHMHKRSMNKTLSASVENQELLERSGLFHTPIPEYLKTAESKLFFRNFDEYYILHT